MCIGYVKKPLLKFFFWTMVIMVLAVISSPVSADEIIVPSDYSTIQEAIDNADPGDTIIVEPGNYYENIVVDVTNLTIRANDTVIIDAFGAENAVLINASEVIFDGFIITNISEYGIGIFVENADEVQILNNSIDLDMSGVGMLVVGNYSEVTNNIITGNTTAIGPVISGGIIASGIMNEIAKNNITIDSKVELEGNTANNAVDTATYVTSSELRQNIKQNLPESLEQSYGVIGQALEETEGMTLSNFISQGTLAVGYVTFGIATNGPSVQVTGNEVYVSGKYTEIAEKNIRIYLLSWVDAYAVGIVALNADPIEIDATTIPAIIDGNTIIVNGEAQIEAIAAERIEVAECPPGSDPVVSPATWSAGIYAAGPKFEVTNNDIIVSGTSKALASVPTEEERLYAMVFFVGKSRSIGILTNNPEGKINGNTISAENLFQMDLEAAGNFSLAIGLSEALSMGISPSQSNDVEISYNDITVNANTNGTVISTYEEVSSAETISGSLGGTLGIGVGIVSRCGCNTSIVGNDINAYGSANLTVLAGQEGENASSIAYGAGIGAGGGMIVNYENNEITRNNVAGTGSTDIEAISLGNYTESASWDIELGIGVFVENTSMNNEISANNAGAQNTTINFNNLVGSSNYGLYAVSNNGPLDVNASYNWWGACDGPSDWGPGTGDAVNGTWNFTPWLTQPFEQHAFYGTVKDVNGNNVPVGAVIKAFINDVERGSITVTEAGKYGSENACEPKLIVQGDLEEAGSEIIFDINGIKANENASFNFGEVTQLNLTASASFQPEKPTPRRNGGDGKERIIYKTAEENVTAVETAEAGGEGIIPTPTPTPEPIATADETPSKPSFWDSNLFKGLLLIMILAVVLIIALQSRKKG